MHDAPTMFDRPDRSTLVTSGHGTATTVPDYALISFDARVVRDAPTEALTAVTGIANRIVAALDDLGVDRQSITTSPGHIDRERSWDSGQERIIGWYAGYTVRVRLSEPTVVFNTILRISGIDDVTISAPNWQIDPDNPAWEQARRAAVADATRRATHFAAAAGLQLGPVVELREGGPAFSPPLFARSAMMTDQVNEPAHGLESVDATVTITFAVSRQ